MKKIFAGLLAALLALSLCACKGADMSVYDVDKDSDGADKGVAAEYWDVHEYKEPKLAETKYRLYRPVKPVNSVTPLATTAFSTADYNLDKMRDNAFLNEKYDLKDAYYEEGIGETYSDGLFMSYLVQDFLMGRYKGESGDFTDFSMSTFFDTAMIENSYASISVEFRDIQGAVTQEQIAEFMNGYFPSDIAEALVYGVDHDGLDEDGTKIAAGCLFEMVTVGDDSYALIRNVTKTDDDRINVVMQVSLEELNGDEELFDDDTDWEKVDLFEHYDGGYTPVVNDLKDIMSENMKGAFSDVGPTELRSSSAFADYFSFSAHEYGLTKPQGYVYRETPSGGGTVRAITAQFQNCMEDVDNAHAPVLNVDVVDMLGRTTVTITDGTGYVNRDDDPELVCRNLFWQRMIVLFGQNPIYDVSMLPYETAVPVQINNAEGYIISGFLAENTDSEGMAISYTIIATDKVTEE